MHTPLPEADQAEVERKVAYDISKKHVTKYQPMIQRKKFISFLIFLLLLPHFLSVLKSFTLLSSYVENFSSMDK